MSKIMVGVIGYLLLQNFHSNNFVLADPPTQLHEFEPNLAQMLHCIS